MAQVLARLHRKVLLQGLAILLDLHLRSWVVHLGVAAHRAVDPAGAAARRAEDLLAARKAEGFLAAADAAAP